MPDSPTAIQPIQSLINPLILFTMLCALFCCFCVKHIFLFRYIDVAVARSWFRGFSRDPTMGARRRTTHIRAEARHNVDRFTDICVSYARPTIYIYILLEIKSAPIANMCVSVAAYSICNSLFCPVVTLAQHFAACYGVVMCIDDIENIMIVGHNSETPQSEKKIKINALSTQK